MAQELEAIAHEARSSIELSVDAKGVYRWTVKGYQGVTTTELCAVADTLHDVDSKLRGLFGVPS